MEGMTMTNEEKKRATEDFMKALNTSDSEVDNLYSAGRLNDIIVGALRITMENLNYDEKEIDEVVYECQRGTFDLYTTSQLRSKAK